MHTSGGETTRCRATTGEEMVGAESADGAQPLKFY
jgi:hypothetical protein